MADYKKMYAILCKSIDDAIDPLEQIPEAKRISKDLQDALLEAEDIYIDTTDCAEAFENSNIIELKERE